VKCLVKRFAVCNESYELE